MTFSFSKRSLQNLDGVHPHLRAVVDRALGYGILDFTVTSGVRTQEQQNLLYAQGRTIPGNVVTWTLNSKHIPQADGLGHAVDLDPYPINYDDEKRYYILAALMLRAAMEEKVHIEYGGFWKEKDIGHFQLT